MTPQMFQPPQQVLISGAEQASQDARILEQSNRNEFRTELESLINQYSMENGSNSPDWLLADYLLGCLDAFDRAVKNRDQQYGIEGIPCNPRISTEENE